MHSSLRRTVALASAALAGCAVAVPLTATPALAAGTPTEKAFLVADTGGGNFGLYTEPVGGGTLTPIVAGTATADVYNESSSADGSRVAFVRDVYPSATASQPTHEQILVADISTRVVRVVADVNPATSAVARPILSPDGNTVVWSQFDTNVPSMQLRKAAVGSGASSVVATGLFGLVFVDPTTLLVNGQGGTETIPLAGGTPAATTGTPIPANMISITVSSDGSQIMWSEDTTPNTPGAPTTTSIGVAPLTVTSGVANVGTVTTLATSGDNEHPAFSHDGHTAYWVSVDSTTFAGTIVKRLVDASAPQADAGLSGTADTPEVAIGTTDDGTAPGAATALPANLNGTSATLHWTNATDSDLSGVLITRKLGTTVQKSNIYVPAPVTSFVDTGLALGSTYSYTFTSVDRSGNQAVSTLGDTRSLVATAPGATFSDPTSTTSAHAPFAVRFGSSASSTKYTVDYVIGGTTTWRRWVTNAAGQTRTFGSAATTGVAATTSTPGATYAFRVGATDAYGNTSAVVTSGRAVVPFDQTKATFVGGSTVASSAAWLGSVRVLKTTASYAKVTLYGNQFRLIGWKCKTCGAFTVYDGKTLVGTVDSNAASGLARVVLYTRTYSTTAWHTFIIRPKATAGRPNVYVDGFGMRR